MKKQILTIMVGAVVMLGAVTTSFARGVGGFPGCDAFHATCTESTSR